MDVLTALLLGFLLSWAVSILLATAAIACMKERQTNGSTVTAAQPRAKAQQTTKKSLDK